ncbi:MAG: DUF6788 family protein [Actinomycetota bacterium]
MEQEMKKTTSHLDKLVHKGSFLRGNPVVMKRVCGNKKCSCYLKGKKHQSIYISKNKAGKRKMIYIPRRLEDEVRAKLDAYQRVKRLVEKISELNYRKLEEDKKIGCTK